MLTEKECQKCHGIGLTPVFRWDSTGCAPVGHVMCEVCKGTGKIRRIVEKPLDSNAQTDLFGGDK